MKPTRSGDVRLLDVVSPLLSRPWRTSLAERLLSFVARCVRPCMTRRCIFVVRPTSGPPIFARTLSIAFQRAAKRLARIFAQADPHAGPQRLRAWVTEESRRWTWSLHCIPATPRGVLALAALLGLAEDSEAVAGLALLADVAPERVAAPIAPDEDEEPTVIVDDAWRKGVVVVAGDEE